MIGLKHILVLMLIVVIIRISKTEEEKVDNYSETTTSIEELDESSGEESDQNFPEDKDYESDSNEDYDDRYPDDINTINTDELNSVINKLVQRLPPPDSEGVLIRVEPKNTTINDTINLMLELQEFFSNSTEAIFKIVMPLFLKYIYEVSYEQFN